MSGVHALIAWSGFVGAWLLFAGPLFQAAVELDAEVGQHGSPSGAALRVGPQPRPSPWWWLLPPVAYVLQRRYRRAYRQQVLDALSRDEAETFVELRNVATGWAMVAGGAFFIAVKETYELAELSEWPGWVFATLLVVMLVLCAAHTVLRLRRTHALLDATARPTPTGADVPGA